MKYGDLIFTEEGAAEPPPLPPRARRDISCCELSGGNECASDDRTQQRLLHTSLGFAYKHTDMCTIHVQLQHLYHQLMVQQPLLLGFSSPSSSAA